MWQNCCWLDFIRKLSNFIQMNQIFHNVDLQTHFIIFLARKFIFVFYDLQVTKLLQIHLPIFLARKLTFVLRKNFFRTNWIKLFSRSITESNFQSCFSTAFATSFWPHVKLYCAWKSNSGFYKEHNSVLIWTRALQNVESTVFSSFCIIRIWPRNS